MLNEDVADSPFGPNSSQHHSSAGVQIVSYSTQEEIPMETARALLTDHLTWAYGKLLALGAAPFDKMRHADKFFDHLNDVLPPRGAYFLAFDPEGQALGTGSLRRISDDMAEMKHLYVRPTARGAGLGERLIAARIDAARTLGVRHLVADTFQGNDPMIRLYRQAGFSDAAPFDSAAAVTTPELIPHLRYFEMRV